MSPPGMQELKENAYKNAFSWLFSCTQRFNRQGNVTTVQAGKILCRLKVIIF